MSFLNRRTFAKATLAGLAAAGLPSSWAQSGSGVRRIVVPFSAGASPDVMARIVAEDLAQRLGENVIVENKPGAGGNLAADYVAKQAADGRTLFFGSTANLAVNKTLYKKLPYDPESDFAAISLAYMTRNVLIVPVNSPYKTVGDVIAAAKARPGTLTFGSPGNGTAGHLIGALFEQATGTSLTHVPYKGQNQVVTDLMGGHIALSFETIGSAMPLLESAKVRALAITGEARHPQLPHIPTFTQSGVDQVDTLRGWAMFVVAKATPAAEVSKLHAALNASLSEPKVKRRLEELGVDVSPTTPQASQRMISNEVRRWGELVRRTGAQAD
jgi:tripartite-type tricarboxylate transporter receptor subunit TctC